MKTYYIYIMANQRNTTLYVGVTNSLQRRVHEHKAHDVTGFTSKYKLEKLVYYESTEDIHSALQREKQLKNWHRQWKNNLIKQTNPHWHDLSTVQFEQKEDRDPETSSG